MAFRGFPAADAPNDAFFLLLRQGNDGRGLSLPEESIPWRVSDSLRPLAARNARGFSGLRERLWRVDLERAGVALVDEIENPFTENLEVWFGKLGVRSYRFPSVFQRARNERGEERHRQGFE